MANTEFLTNIVIPAVNLLPMGSNFTISYDGGEWSWKYKEMAGSIAGSAVSSFGQAVSAGGTLSTQQPGATAGQMTTQTTRRRGRPAGRRGRTTQAAQIQTLPGLSESQTVIYNCLAQHPGWDAQQISSFCNMRPNITQLALNRMLGKNYLTRQNTGYAVLPLPGVGVAQTAQPQPQVRAA
jgi:hypothetical protein